LEEVPAEMQHCDESPALASLEPLIGEWSVQAVFPGAPPSDVRGRTVFEWWADRSLLVQRWQVPHPEAPDGIAIIRFDERRGALLQHYFDARGIARVYEMSLTGGTWKLSRTEADVSPLEFSQRFTGTLDADGNTIAGRWEISRDGSRWEHDFDLLYTRISAEQA
jgi:hypothetical protein